MVGSDTGTGSGADGAGISIVCLLCCHRLTLYRRGSGERELCRRLMSMIPPVQAGPDRRTYLRPLDTEGIHLQSIQPPGKILIECAECIV